mmetsp:Transcript_88348/g.156401  ORF Transcript_88348/g.156401 Transcript_88348/m.156401 type:complete len:421 (-) Transcript_88348:55-1317(-)
MPECSYDMALPNPLDAGTDAAYVNVVKSIQDLIASHASSQQALLNEVENLRVRNTQLRAQNQALQQEKSNLLQRKRNSATAAYAQGNSRRDGERQASQVQGTFEFVRNYTLNDQPVHSIAMHHDLNMFATASWDGKVKLVKVGEDGDNIRTLGENDPMGGLYTVAFSKPIGSNDRQTTAVLGCASCDKTVYLWDYEKGVMKQKLNAHMDEVNCIDFHETQFVMASASDDKKCIIWDYHEGLELRKLDKHEKAVYGARFLGTEHQYMVATCSFDRYSRIFDMRNKKVTQSFQHHTDDVIGIDYASSKQLLATGSDDGMIMGYDVRANKQRFRINTRQGDMVDNEVKRIAFSANGDMLAAGISSNAVLVYDLRPSQPTLCATLGGHADCVFDVTWGVNPRNGANLVVSASHDHTSRLWREIK